MKMMNTWLALCVAIPVIVAAGTPKVEVCPVCHSASTIVRVDSLRDEEASPSWNITVWNRSACGNLAHLGNSIICTNCWYARSVLSDSWELARQTTNGFARALRNEIANLPLPEKTAITSLVVYTQEITTNAVVDKVGFWTKLNGKYEDAIRAYAKANGVGLEVNRHSEMKEMYVCGGVRTRMKPPNKMPEDTARKLADPQHERSAR